MYKNLIGYLLIQSQSRRNYNIQIYNSSDGASHMDTRATLSNIRQPNKMAAERCEYIFGVHSVLWSVHGVMVPQ
jgi:hypothetical protein